MSNYKFYLIRISAGAVASGVLYLATLDPELPHFFTSPALFLPALFLGILVPFGSNVFYFEALRRGDLCVVAPAAAITPLFVALLAWPLLNELPTVAVAGALVLTVTGLILSARGKHATHPHLGAWVILPVALATGTSLCNSFNYVFQKKLLQDLPKTDINFLLNVVSLILFTVYYAWATAQRNPSSPRTEQRHRRNVLLTIASGVLVFALGNLSILTAISLAPRVSVVMVLATLYVPISALFGWVLLRERPTPVQLSGGGLIFVGAVVAKIAG
jgi:drug/metabolite transporter (DMT)-like permease